MKKKIILFIFISGSCWTLWLITREIFSFFDHKKERTYTLLTVYDSDENPNLKKAFIFFFRYPKPYLLFFSIGENVMISQNAMMNNILTGNKNDIKKKIEKVYGFHIDYFANPSRQQIEKILKILGGDLIFNIHSNAFPKGELFVDRNNYQPYLQGIKNQKQKEDAQRAFWYKNLDSYRKKTIQSADHRKSLKEIYKNLSIDASWPHFCALIAPLLREKTEIFFHSLRANLEFFSIGQQKYLVPYKDGKYDKNRIKEHLLLFKKQPLEKIYFPIVMQIRNTTKINRLAARTTGILRLKRIDVLEYRNSSIPMKNSVLLDYSLSPTKREYVKKVTRINKVYPAFDYQKKFDFSVYIAEDYYAIDLIKKKK